MQLGGGRARGVSGGWEAHARASSSRPRAGVRPRAPSPRGSGPGVSEPGGLLPEPSTLPSHSGWGGKGSQLQRPTSAIRQAPQAAGGGRPAARQARRPVRTIRGPSARPRRPSHGTCRGDGGQLAGNGGACVASARVRKRARVWQACARARAFRCLCSYVSVCSFCSFVSLCLSDPFYLHARVRWMEDGYRRAEIHRGWVGWWVGGWQRGWMGGEKRGRITICLLGCYCADVCE